MSRPWREAARGFSQGRDFRQRIGSVQHYSRGLPWWKGTINGHAIESFDVLVDNDYVPGDHANERAIVRVRAYLDSAMVAR